MGSNTYGHKTKPTNESHNHIFATSVKTFSNKSSPYNNKQSFPYVKFLQRMC
ncbi:unnamed protein product [Brassica rapa subsp. narinosa]